MPDHPKGGFTEFCFKHGASQQGVMNVIGEGGIADISFAASNK